MSVDEGSSQRNNPPSRKVVSLDNAERLSALSVYEGIIARPSDASLTELAQLSAQITQSSVAAITMVDDVHQWFVASCGGDTLDSAPLEDGFCPITVSQGDPLVIEDAMADPRFCSNPAVVERNTRFYAGIPLSTPAGYIIGTLCVVDFVPRQLPAQQLKALHKLARQVMHQLNLRLGIDKVKQVTQVLTSVSCGVANQVGETFFPTLVQRFTEILNVEYAYIALLSEDASDCLETIAASHQGRLADNFGYSLSQAPCENVVAKATFCHHPQNLQQEYPDFPLIRSAEIESYAAMPILDQHCQVLGVLAVLDTKPMLNEQPAGSLLTIFSSRIAAELERQKDHERQQALLAREQEVRQQSELANRMKDEFLAVISHELRSPLNPILGWTTLLRRGGLSSKKIKNALASIERNALLQVRLIDDLLDISRLLRNKLPLRRTPVNLCFVVNAAIETVAQEAKSKSISIDLQSRLQTETVKGDEIRLQQVFGNLIDNAVKFTPPEGQVSIILSACALSELPVGSFSGDNISDYSEAAQFAHVQIRDTGRGISASFLPNVFERFRQEDYSTTRQFSGLGVGLAIVKQIVEMHDGIVTVQSEGKDKGTVADVYFPLLVS
ncbi:MAG: GAF domain-containing sensor histidine kinase [Cyanobacteria bacterium J06560_6]